MRWRSDVASAGLLLLFLGSIAGAAGPTRTPRTTCTSAQEGDAATRDASSLLNRRSKTVLESHQARILPPGDESFAVVLKRGRHTTMETSIVIHADGSSDFVRKLGRGFKGVKEIHGTRGGGADSLTVDGRAVSVAALQGNTPSLVFADGKPAPRFHVKRAVARLLPTLSAALEALSSCNPTSAAETRGARANCDPWCDPFYDECERCQSTCFARAYVCFAASIGAAELIGLLDSDVSCGGALQDCTDLCNSVDHACCRVHCGEQCCGRAAVAADTVCSGARPDFAGVCCSRDGACGDSCCGPGKTCANPAQKLCCDAGQSACGNFCCGGSNGSFCADAATSLCCGAGGDGCGFLCCPAGQRCASPSNDPDLIVCNVCPPGKTGPACGTTCCGADEICDGDECCRADTTCGGSCCAPENCLNGNNCCAPPNHACGASCCAPFQACCNGQCCDGSCVGGVCCAPEHACGSTCCPDGWTCTDVANGTCQPCAAGKTGCAPVAGNPSCCTIGTECCSSGDCCASPLVCCAPAFGPIGCYPQASCLN